LFERARGGPPRRTGCADLVSPGLNIEISTSHHRDCHCGGTRGSGDYDWRQSPERLAIEKSRLSDEGAGRLTGFRETTYDETRAKLTVKETPLFAELEAAEKNVG
jgi:hypothetical protein